MEEQKENHPRQPAVVGQGLGTQLLTEPQGPVGGSKRKESKPFDSLSTLSEMVIYLFGRRLSLLFNVVFTAINRLSDFGVRTLFPFGNTIPLSCVFAYKGININRNSQVFYFF